MGELTTFPVSYKVEGQRIVIVGGGEEALNKARLAIKTTALVVIISRTFEVDFSGLPVTLLPRGFEPADLVGAALVFVADHGPDGAAAKVAARAAKIPLNVVDVPEECDFYTPAIIDRAPITIAVASEGDAPVLARLIRARIEAALSPNLGAMARLAGSMRDKVAALLQGPRARRYYEELVTSPEVEAELIRGQGMPKAEALLAQHVENGESPGVVWLIGAGPGAEDLLTLRAQRLLQEADVIVHDHLVPAAAVEMGRRDAERILVGKQKGHHSFTQAEINGLIVRLAKQGKRVARLKGGDPMVFGRAGEEIDALNAAGIAYHVVPGVTAALAAAADTATPVTLRKISTGFVLATAHGAESEELRHWAALASAGLTLALYMGKSVAGQTAARLIAEGAGADIPVGVVVRAGRRDRVLYRGTLGSLASGDAALEDGPAIIFVGEAIAHGDWSGAIEIARSQFKVA
ncbi:MAG: uroporphyrinogen-III C-methyltransferase [Devosia sp.]|uniref:siroheme synthase CysG n=1 Tax=Devosia sp. TaxID=1871048 RepID=UPI001ACFB326|nr:siroheme synthase CysG [Devosia sp.]MBN9314700.1 uroporphyrinogen-III C-methyltransferase [Devosia sp.]